jgi:hypothetical protein
MKLYYVQMKFKTGRDWHLAVEAKTLFDGVLLLCALNRLPLDGLIEPLLSRKATNRRQLSGASRVAPTGDRWETVRHRCTPDGPTAGQIDIDGNVVTAELPTLRAQPSTLSKIREHVEWQKMVAAKYVQGAFDVEEN